MENYFAGKYGEEQGQVLLQRELEVVNERYPGYLRTFHQKMWNGQVNGLHMSVVLRSDIPVACFYGWLNDTLKRENDDHNWKERDKVATILGLEPNKSTAIEDLIIDIKGETTPNNSEELALLDELITPFLALPGEEEK